MNRGGLTSRGVGGCVIYTDDEIVSLDAMDLFGGSNGSKDDASRVRRVPVSASVLRRLWAQRRADPTIGACCAHIVSRVVGGGFSFVSLSGREPSREFTRHVDSHFVPFAKSALEAILVQGYVVFDVRRRIRRAPYPVPFVCQERAYDARVVLDDDETRLEIATDENHRRRRHVFVQDAPTLEGEPTSRVALVSRCVSYLEEIERHDVRAFAIRACPPVLTRTQTDTAFDSRDVLGAADAVPGLRAQDEHDNMGVRNKINVAQFRQQQDLIRTLNDKRIDSSAGFWNQHVDPTNDTYLSETLRAHTEGYVPRFIPLPNDANVAPFVLPNERHDLVSLQRHVKKQVCTGMGVPEALIDGTNGGGRQGEHAMRLLNEFSEVTLAPLRDTMRRLMLEVYALCFDEDESRDVECAFPIKRDPSKIIEYHQRGYVNFDAVVRTLTQSENLGPTDFHRGGDTPPNPPGVAKGDRRDDRDRRRGNRKGDDHEGGDREGAPPIFEKKRELSPSRRGYDEEKKDDGEEEEEEERKTKTEERKRKRKGEGASSGSSSSSEDSKGSKGSKTSKGSGDTTTEDSADSGNGTVKKKKRKRRRKKKKSVSE